MFILVLFVGFGLVWPFDWFGSVWLGLAFGLDLRWFSLAFGLVRCLCYRRSWLRARAFAHVFDCM